MPESTTPLHAKLWRLFDAEFQELVRHQVLDRHDDRYGAWISPETGYDEPGHTGLGRLFMMLHLAYLADPQRYGRGRLLEALSACGAYWLRVRRPEGRIDLRNCNQDSGPDTAFLLQQVMGCLALAKQICPQDAALASATADASAFARDAARALVDGGIHTPNHRWILVSAMTQAAALWPELASELNPAARAYIAEEPDLDDEGVFIERSVAVYDAVNVRALLMVHQLAGWPEGLRAAEKCLDFDLDLFHPDGTVDTQLSHRYDFGTRPVPLGLIACYLMFARVASSPMHASHAAWMFERFPETGKQDRSQLMWLVFETLLGNALPDTAAALPDIERHRPGNKIVRIRRSGASLSLYGGTNRLASFMHGRAYLHSVMAGQSYLGHGRFVGDELHGSSGRYLLHSRGRLDPYRLGYAQALGRQVTPASWPADYALRELRAVPDCASDLEVDWRMDAREIRLHYRSASGLPGVLAQISFDFPAGGVWEGEDSAFQPVAGQVIVLRRGSGRMIFEGDWISVEGGADGHRPWAMRDYPPASQLVRVTIPLITPVDHTVVLRWGSGPA